MKIELPFPPKELNPNKRLHWRAKSQHAAGYKTMCFVLTKKQIWGIRPLFSETEGAINLKITFHPPDKRHRDDDNMVSSFKSGRDGVAEAMGVNDKRFRCSYEICDPTPGGKVVVMVN
jgi:crossover junction endodeoxyribonuclease RusA